MNNNNQFVHIPIAIIIYENDDQIFYQSYSPTEYNFQPDSSSPNHRDSQFGQFLAHLYTHLAYDQQNPLNNITNCGILKEIHTRHIQIPIDNRGNICYFTVYNNPNTNYKPVHHKSPIFFDINEANNYANLQPNLIHIQCHHEFL